MATAEDALNLARSKLGYAEGPRNNETIFGAWSGFQYQAWCCSFTSWVLDQVGLGMGKIAYCPTAVAYWKAKGRLFSTPQVGDQALYFWNGRYAHTGLVERIDGDSIIAIEGNTDGTGSAEGGAVMRKRRPWRGTKTVFGRPAYEPARQASQPLPFAISPPNVLRPIVAEYVPPEGGIVLVADNGDAYAYGGAQYPGALQLGGLNIHDPIHVEPIVSDLRDPDGTGTWLFAASGAVYAFFADYHGGANGQDYFKGRLTARGIRSDAPEVPEENRRPGSYAILATSGEVYGPYF